MLNARSPQATAALGRISAAIDIEIETLPADDPWADTLAKLHEQLEAAVGVEPPRRALRRRQERRNRRSHTSLRLVEN